MLESVDGRRPYCTTDGVGAVLAVFRANGLTGPATRVVSVNQPAPATPFVGTYEQVAVEPAQPGVDYVAAGALIVAVRGDAPAVPAVPADAVTAGGSGLDPHISPAYADLQVSRVARERGADPDRVRELVVAHTTGGCSGSSANRASTWSPSTSPWTGSFPSADRRHRAGRRTAPARCPAGAAPDNTAKRPADPTRRRLGG